MKKFYAIYSLLILFLFIDLPSNLYSQSSTFLYPTNNQINVELQPSIIIATDYKIDSSSIKLFYFGQDSSEYNFNYNQSILLLPEFLIQILNDTTFKKASIIGDYQLLDTNIIMFTPKGELKSGLDYVITLKNLKIIEPTIGDTIPVSENSITFTTAFPAHNIELNPNINNSLINCHDTLWVKFNRPIDNIANAMGSLIELNIIDSTKVVNDTLVKYTTQFPLNVFVDQNDSTIVRAKPNGEFTMGKDYVLKINPGYFSGDTNTNAEVTIRVRDRFMVLMNIKNDDTTQSAPEYCTLPRQGITSHNVGELVKFVAEKKVGNLIFIKWECPNDTAINNLQTNSFTLNQNCETLKDYYVTAIYKQIDTIKLVVDADQYSTISVYDKHMNYLGSSGTYTIAPDDYLFALAAGDSTHSFNNWSSSEQCLNGNNPIEIFSAKGINKPLKTGSGNQENVKITNNGRDIDLNGQSQENNTPSDYGINFISYFDDVLLGDDEFVNLPQEQGFIQILVNDVPISGTTYSSGNRPDTVDVTFKISKQMCISYNPLLYFDWIDMDCAGINVYHWENTPPNYPDSIRMSGIITMPKQNEYTRNILVAISPSRIPKYNVMTSAVWNNDSNVRAFGTGIIGKDVTIAAEVLLGDKVVQTKTIKPDENPMSLNVYCEQQVRFTGLPNLKGPGFHFQDWKNNQNFSHPNPNTIPQWTLTVDGNKNVRGILTEGFRLIQIGFYLDKTRESNEPQTGFPIWYDPMIYWNNSNVTLHNIEVYDYNQHEETGYGANIFLEFNSIINQSDFFDGKLWVEEITERIDGKLPTRYFASVQNTLLDNNLFPQWGTVLTFNVKNNIIAIPKGELFKIHLEQIHNSNIDGTMGDLGNSGEFTSFETEIPGTVFQINSIYCNTDADGWSWDGLYLYDDTRAEIFIPWATSILGLNDITHNLSIIKTDHHTTPTDDYISINEYETNFPDPPYILFETNQMLYGDIAEYLFLAYDFDMFGNPGDVSYMCNDNINNFDNNFISGINIGLNNITTNHTKWTDWEKIWKQTCDGLESLNISLFTSGKYAAIVAFLETILDISFETFVPGLGTIIQAIVTWGIDELIKVIYAWLASDLLQSSHYMGTWESWYGNKDNQKSKWVSGDLLRINVQTHLKKKEITGDRNFYK